MLKTGDYDLCSMRMEQYLTHTYYALWEVIINGDSHVFEPPDVGTVVPPKNKAKKLARKNELKAKSTLLLAIPDEHLLKFYSIKDAKSLWEAIKIRTKPLTGFKNLSINWNLMPDKETLSMDDLYNNLKVYEAEIKGQSSSGSNSYNVAFVSSENTSSINEIVTTSHDIPAAGSKEKPFASSYANDVAMITIRVKKFMKRTGRNLNFNSKKPVGFDKTKVECYNCHRRGHFARECRAPKNHGNRSADNKRRVVTVDTPTSALVLEETIKEKDDLKEKLTKFEESSKKLLACDSQLSENEMPKCEIFETTSDSSMSEIDEDNNQEKDRYKVEIGYHALPPCYTRNYMPPRADLSFARLDESMFKFKISETRTCVNENELIASKSSEEIIEEPKTVRPKAVVNAAEGKKETAVKTSAEYQKINGGFVAFEGSPKGDFKLLDESQVLLKVSRQNNMYSFDLKNVVPLGDLTCLFAKATIDEFNLWHRILGHINFKTLNKLVRGNLMKGIKREFSVARTPQQNRVVEKKNRTLIEAARTVLADSFYLLHFRLKQSILLVMFKIEFVAKPHNKKPYELLIGRSPNLGFIRPFGCPVTILNTVDHLGEFDGKADEGFLFGYSVNSKAFRVFNSRTRKVEEYMHGTAKVKKVNDQEHIQALVDKTKVIITEDNIRSDLRLDDAEGTVCLLNEEIFEGFSRVITPLCDSMMVQAATDMGDTPRKEAETSHDELEDEDHVLAPSSNPLPSGEDSSLLNELMVFCTSLQEQRKSISGGLERLKKFGSVRRVKSPMEKDGLGAQEDASKQERMIEEIDQNAEIALDDETQGRTNDDEMFEVDDLAGEVVVMDSAADPITTVKDSAALTIDVTEDEITMAQALAALKSVKPKVVVQEQEMSTTIPAAATIVTTIVPTPRAKVPLKKKEQMRIDEEYARKLQAEEQKAARLSKAQQDEEANNSWDNMQAMMDADRLLAERLQVREREEFSKVQKAKLLVELIEKRKKHFTALRAQEKRSKPPTKTQMKSQMSTYLRHMGGYKQSHLKEISFDEIKELFDREMKKKQKLYENVKPAIDDSEELRKCIEIAPDDGDEVLIEATPISSRSPTINDYKIHKEEDLEVLWAIVKDKFKKEKLVDDMDNILFRTLKTMFEHYVEDTIWKYQQILAKVKYWKLFESCRSDVRLQMDNDVEMAYDLLRFIIKQLMEGYTYRKVFGYILLMKTKILIKKLEDSKDEYQV
nr:retrovirus-related Pol polyprotein from transposon TNT 1-94 [Tanacetum cinerariifolium]